MSRVAVGQVRSGDAGTRPPLRRDVQGLRAVAIVLVVGYHAGLPIPGGFVGVDVFFVISGFVIGGLILREIGSDRGLRFGRFYHRRMRRLLPAAALMLVTTIILSGALLSPIGPTQGQAGHAASAASVFLANLYFWLFTGGYFNPRAEASPVLHTWSLSVEEQFYFIFPALLVVIWRLRRRLGSAWAVACLVGLALASLFLCVAMTIGDPLAWPLPHGIAARVATYARSFAFFSPFTRSWEFLAGVLLMVSLTRLRLTRSAARCAAITGAAGLIASALLLSTDDAFPGYLAILPATSTVLLILSGSGPHESRITAGLSTRPMVALGGLSYSWYLWHWPLIVFAGVVFRDAPWAAPLAAAASLLPAVASYRWVEKPIHLDRALTSARASALLLSACITIPFLGGLALANANAHGWWQPRIASANALIAERYPAPDSCQFYGPVGQMDAPACTWEVPDSKGTVLLVGDSHALHVSGPVIRAANGLGYDVQVSISPGCAFAAGQAWTTTTCQHFVKASLESIMTRSSPFAAVIVSDQSTNYPFQAAGLADGSAIEVGQPAVTSALSSWSARLAETLGPVAARGPVLVLGDVAKAHDFPRCLAPNLLSPPTSDCGLSGSAVAKQRYAVARAEQTALESVGVHYYDAGAQFCDGDRECAFEEDGLPLSRDGSHLTAEAAMRLAEPIQATLQSLLGAGAASP